MTNAVRFNVVSEEPVELEIDDAGAIDALNDVQVKKLHDALDEFLNVTPIEDGDFFDRIIESGVVYFYVPASGNQDEVIPKAGSAQD